MREIYINYLDLIIWARDHATDKIPVDIVYETAIKSVTDDIALLELLMQKKGANELKREIDLIEKANAFERSFQEKDT